MTGIGVIFNIRFRLLLIILITTTALILQGNLITDSQDIQSSIEDQGNRHLELDAEILLDIAELELLVESMGRLNYENFFDLLLFNNVTEGTKADSIIDDYNLKFDQTIEKLTAREENNYEIEVNETNILNLETVDADLVAEVGDIINQQPVGNALLEIRQLRSKNYASMVKIESNTANFRTTYEENANNFLTNYSDFTDITVVDMQETFYDSVHRLDISELSVVQTELNDSADTLAIIGIDPSEPVNESIALTYMFVTKDLFIEIREHVEGILSEWSNLLQIMAIRNGTIDQGLDQIIEDFNFTIGIHTQDINDLADLLDGAVLPAEQGSLNIVTSTYSNDFIPSLHNMVNLIETMYSGLTDIQNLIDENFVDIFDQVAISVGSATNTINLEAAFFVGNYTLIIDSVRTNFDELIQLTSAVLIVGTVVLLLLVALQLVRSLRSIRKDYVQLSRGNIGSLKKKRRYSSSEFGDMQRGFDEMVNNLRSILQTLQATSERLAGIAEELAAGAQEASASVNEVSETVREFSSGSSEQNLLLNRVSQKLEAHLTDVEEAARRIGETSNFVLKVAKRTNILGLNASIEAAKAGKFGLGFNVVAEEVRNLSEDTKASATQIADLIEEVEFNIKNTVEEMQKEVNITKEVAENTAAGSEEANAATSEQVIMLKEISTTSNDLSLLAQELREIIHGFTLE
jgi:methyl-accepting chemotaxis protein